MNEHIRLRALTLCLAAIGLLSGPVAGTDARASGTFEVWAVDQSGSAGTLYVYDGEELNADPKAATPEVVDLSLSVTPLCVAQTGTAPTRGHMLMFNATRSHAILAYVATGHVVFIDAAARLPQACIDVGVQAHAAFPAPDGSYVAVANQNGKLLQRIQTDYATNTFTLDAAATIDLATCVTPSGAPCEDPQLRPDTAPICPVIESSSRLVFTTLRGGGMFVIDGTTTPMSIVAEYDSAAVRGNGCGGVESGGRMYINAGAGTAGNPTSNHLYTFSLDAYPDKGAAPPNTPRAHPIYQMDGPGHDGHGMLINSLGAARYLWVADRFANQVMVVDTRAAALTGVFRLAGEASSDPAPDLIELSPDGLHAYAALRGPCPLTANVPGVDNAVGSTPGVGVISVLADGRSGRLAGVAPITQPVPPFVCTTVGGMPLLTEAADPHTVAVRPQ